MSYTKNPPSRSSSNGTLELTLLNERVRQHQDLLRRFAGKYIWWLSAEESMEFPGRVIAQVMNIGVFEDVAGLLDSLGEASLKAVLQQSEAGQFSSRSWHYWHYRLGLADPNQVPPLPTKHIPGTL